MEVIKVCKQNVLKKNMYKILIRYKLNEWKWQSYSITGSKAISRRKSAAAKRKFEKSMSNFQPHSRDKNFQIKNLI